MITYNNILTALENFGNNHYMINSFSHGNVEEMDLSKIPEYPLMHVIYTGSEYNTDKQKEYGFEIYFVEAPIGDDKDTNKQTYQREAISDMEQIAEDLITDVRVGFNIFNEDFHFDEEEASVIPIEEESTNVLSGVALSISISVPYLNDYCAPPLTGVTPTGDLGGNAGYTNSDGSFTVTIPGGSTYTAADINVTEADGSTSTSPSNVDVACAFPNLTLQNTATDPIGSVTTYPAGGVVVVQDANVINSDASVDIPVPSGETTIAPDITLTEVDGTVNSALSLVNLVCSWVSLQVQNSATDPIGNVASYPASGIIPVIDTPITNSDTSFNADAPSGIIYIAPDINLTEMDGAVTAYPSIKDLVCTWANIRVNNTASTGLLNITSYPAGGIAIIPNDSVSAKNSDTTVIEASIPYVVGSDEITLADAEIEDSASSTFDVALCNVIKVPNSVVTSVVVAGNEMTINTPTAASPSGIAYMNSRPMGAISYVANDSIDSFIDGDYAHTNPVYPVSYAEVDNAATQADVRGTPATGTSGTDSVGQTMLLANNQFGNKFRYTDDAGNESDATVGSNLWAHVDWSTHSWTGATNYYVIDHLENWGFTTQYADDSGTVNLNGSNTWAQWITYISTVTWQSTYSGFIPLDMGEVSNAHGGKCNPTEVWANLFFTFDASVSGATRGGFLTGESNTSSDLYTIYDSGNNSLVIELTKSISSGFQSRLTNVFMKRKHY
jgi:hypothetical protein